MQACQEEVRSSLFVAVRREPWPASGSSVEAFERGISLYLFFFEKCYRIIELDIKKNYYLFRYASIQSRNSW